MKIHQHIINWVGSIATGAYHYLSKKLSDLAARISEVAHKVFNKTTTQSPAKTFSATPIHTTPLTLEELKKELDKWKNTPGKESEPREKACQIIIDCFQSQITTLDLSNFKFGKGDFLDDSDDDEEIEVKYNPLTDLPSVIFRLTHLTELYITNNKLTSLPDTIGELVNLQKLDLSQNDLSVLPDQVTKLKKLCYLNLEGNSLKQLPSLSNLTLLRTLQISRNKLTALPDMSALINLTTLLAEKNEIESIPKEIGALRSLITLKVGENKIGSIPREIGQLPILQEARFSNNRLRSLPVELGNIRALVTLELNENPLEELPITLRNLPSLKLYGKNLPFANTNAYVVTYDHSFTPPKKLHYQEGPENFLDHKPVKGVFSTPQWHRKNRDFLVLLNLWEMAAKLEDSLSLLPAASETEEEGKIKKWFLETEEERKVEKWLTEIAAFNCIEGKQEITANKVCNMIKHLNNPEWKASFMANIEAGESVDALYEKYLKQSIIRTDKSD